MKSWITTPQVTELLEALYADAAINDPIAHKAAEESGAFNQPGSNFYQGVRKA